MSGEVSKISYAKELTHYRIYCEQDAGGEDSWSIDGCDGDGNPSEACYTFATLEELLIHIENFIQLYPLSTAAEKERRDILEEFGL